MKNIAIFASGTGSNALQIIDYFETHDNIEIALVVSNNKDAKVLLSAQNKNIHTKIISAQDFNTEHYVLNILATYNLDLIVLAGFLLLIPSYVVKAYPQKIINIHPALLPQYGGKGMYGNHVHKAVYENNEKQSGITIHFVNEQYDEGDIIFQKKVKLLNSDTPKLIAQKVLKLEHENYKIVIEKLLNTKNQILFQ